MELNESNVHSDPLAQFGRWYEEAERGGLALPQAMALATAGSDGAPSVRMVLLKGFDRHGFLFFTSFQSRKARELEANPRAALLFYWESLGRQVRIEGTVGRAAQEETEAYVRSRAPASQISALASPQSQVVASRAELEAGVADLAARYDADSVPLPEHWGGYRLRPEQYELWQRREDRLHDRLRYRHTSGEWIVERLAP
jgi:pyridoxamine 5'-phosphate oxidase